MRQIFSFLNCRCPLTSVTRLIKHKEGSFSLQDPVSLQFLSPEIMEEPEKDWILRKHCEDWEKFSAEYEQEEDSSDGSFGIRCGASYLSMRNNKDGSKCTRRHAAPRGGWERWRFKLADIPTINIAALVADHANLATIMRLDQLSDAALRVVRKISRACGDIGFYHVVGHGLPMTALDVSKLQAQQQPMYLPGGSGEIKTNTVLVKSRCRPDETLADFCEEDLRRITGCDTWPVDTPARLAVEYASGTKRLMQLLLHAMALGQLIQNPVLADDPDWWRWKALPPQGGTYPKGAFMALRLLVYRPVSEGTPMMHPHRDATWITLLAQDCEGGLFVAKDTGNADVQEFEAVPVAGAILINTGMALQELSQGAFRATCHRVAGPRLGPNECGRTRVSMPFFYDATDKERTVGGCEK